MAMLIGTNGNDSLYGEAGADMLDSAAEFAIKLTGVSTLAATEFVL
jgi:Ca2+-binding RTX toxin-like protein